MNKIDEVSFSDIKADEEYHVFVEKYERYGGGEWTFYRGNGDQVIQLIQDIYFYDLMKNEYEGEGEYTIEMFLESAEKIMGDGHPWVCVFPIKE